MDTKKDEIRKFGKILLEIGSLLMSSGASTGRIRVTINRISEGMGYKTELLITQRALVLSITDEQENDYYSSIKRTLPHGVNFKLVSGISRMSWRIINEKWSVDQINTDLTRLKSLPHFPRLVILTFVAMAGASFCRLFGGGYLEMIVAFIATFFGLFVRQEAIKRNYNTYLCIVFASFAATLIAGASVYYGVGKSAEVAFATSVLFLIPGVPFINALSDMIDGNISAGVARVIHGLIISFAIALGMFLSMLIYNI